MKALVIVALWACTDGVADTGEIYSRGGESIVCGLGVDGDTISIEDLEAGMQRALERDEVLHLFAHRPSVTISHARLAEIFATATRSGLPYVTFVDLREHRGAGLAFGFDDAFVPEWFAVRELLAAYGARVTFFVSNFAELDRDRRDQLHLLAADGHAIEAHGMGHRNAASYVDDYGLPAYLAHEIDPLLAAMREDGFAPTTFAYPYGDRTSQLDDALLDRFAALRSVSYLDRSLVQSAPCPY